MSIDSVVFSNQVGMEKLFKIDQQNKQKIMKQRYVKIVQNRAMEDSLMGESPRPRGCADAVARVVGCSKPTYSSKPT